ncbi:MAG: type II toxin-antitoxin system HicA family toxin [Phycisphaerales bacterium]
MSTDPVIAARTLIRVLERLGFVQVRSKGSHQRFVHPDGRRTTVPVHKGRDIPRGLLRSIVTQDVGITMREFFDLL